MYPDAIRVDGKVAVRYYQPIPKLVVIKGQQHVCDVRHAVSMLLLDESDVSAALEYLGGCCGGQRKVFSLPNQETVNVWLTGDR
jgi:hypothetical protein